MARFWRELKEQVFSESPMAKIVSTESQCEGLRLAAPVMNSYGQTILAAGTVIELRHRRLFSIWSIKHISVLMSDDEVFEPGDALRVVAEERLRQRVKWQPRNSHERDLLELAIARVLRIIGGQ
jgi:hypothetical protein